MLVMEWEAICKMILSNLVNRFVENQKGKEAQAL